MSNLRLNSFSAKSETGSWLGKLDNVSSRSLTRYSARETKPDKGRKQPPVNNGTDLAVSIARIVETAATSGPTAATPNGVA